MYMVSWRKGWDFSLDMHPTAQQQHAVGLSSGNWRRTQAFVLPPLDWPHVLSAIITGRLVCPSVCCRCLTATGSAWQVCGGAWDLA